MSHHILTPVVGGHVHAGTWEHFATRRDVNCVACGISVKSDGRLIEERGEGPDTEPNLCPGWQARPVPTTAVLADVVRAIVREAPNDSPIGLVEEAVVAVRDAHLDLLGAHDGQGVIVPVALVKAEREAIGWLAFAIADQVRALRLALEHDEGLR